MGNSTSNSPPPSQFFHPVGPGFESGFLRPASGYLFPWLTAGFATLYGAAGLVLSGSLLAVPGRSGFLVGHVLITVSWTVAALVLLVRGIDVVVLRATGLILVGAAVLKLILFDLSALDGIARVAVFFCAGLVFLTAGTRYARLVSTRSAEKSEYTGEPTESGHSNSA